MSCLLPDLAPPSGPAVSPSDVDETLLPASGPARVESGRVTIEVVPGYEILEELGRGGMGVVFKARQTGLNRLVALKMILSGARASGEERMRFLREAEAIARLQHPNIVQVHAIGEQSGQPYFSLEFCAGGSMAEHLHGTPLPPRSAAAVAESLAQAMAVAHAAGILHRDLKPGNILVQPLDGSGHSAPPTGCVALGPHPAVLLKVADFGLARPVGGDSHTATGDILGTPSYMAPEQAAGKTGLLGPAADIYSLGAILYECLTGRPPFRAATPMETLLEVVHRDPVPPRVLQSGVPRDLDTICLKCLLKDPGQRYASAEGLADDLRRYLDGRPIQARRVGRAARLLRWARRRPMQAGLLLVMAAMLLVGLAGWAVLTAQLRHERERVREERDELEDAHRLAERRFREALGAVDHYFTEISESTLLHEPGARNLRQRLLAQARQFYARFTAERQDDPHLADELACCTMRLGIIDVEVGDYVGAAAQFRDSILRFEGVLSNGRPNDAGRERSLIERDRAKALTHLGHAQRLCGRLPESAAAYQSALEAWRELRRKNPAAAAPREGLAQCLRGLGLLRTAREKTPPSGPRR